MKIQNVSVTKSLMGKYRVSFDCPSCHERLRCPLDDAGKDDSCSVCQTRFIVPGKGELEEIRLLERSEAEAKDKKKKAKTNAKKIELLSKKTVSHSFRDKSGSVTCPYCGHQVASNVLYTGQKMWCQNCTSELSAPDAYLAPTYGETPQDDWSTTIIRAATFRCLPRYGETPQDDWSVSGCLFRLFLFFPLVLLVVGLIFYWFFVEFGVLN